MVREGYMKFGVSQNGAYCECSEKSLGRILLEIFCFMLGGYVVKKTCDTIIPPVGKKFDSWLNEDNNWTKNASMETNTQNSHQVATKEKEEPLTDFSKPISQGEKVKFLVGDLFPEGGITLVAGAKSTGKSIFCMQIAQTLAKVGEHTLFNVNDADNTPLTVIYADYELNDRQIASRYPGLQNNTYFKWGHIENTNPTHVIKSLKKQLDNINTTSALIIIDNLTKIKGLSSHTNADDFYASIATIRDEYKEKGINVTFILVAHLEREKNIYKEITPADMTGAAYMYYSADAVLCLGIARNNNTYLKELTIRDREAKNDVYLLKRTNTDGLYFNFIEMTTEQDALPVKSGDKNTAQKLNEEVEIEDEIIKQARDLSKEEVKAKKDELPTENLYDNMSDEEKEEALNIARSLKNVADSPRHACKIMFLKYGIYITHPTVRSAWKKAKP